MLAIFQWGEAQTNYVKGSIALSDIVEVQEGAAQSSVVAISHAYCRSCVAVASDELKFTVLSKGRLLDLEAKSGVVRTNWINALRWYIANKK